MGSHLEEEGCPYHHQADPLHHRSEDLNLHHQQEESRGQVVGFLSHCLAEESRGQRCLLVEPVNPALVVMALCQSSSMQVFQTCYSSLEVGSGPAGV